ncbi:hypothetical protein Ahy_A04g021551 [Arachis hypogaea]|uniref:Uncharacterized protein n=1 Tax=Arachis hypogaea TaxID=3818 RepID=A0A445DKS4_ARAHY|nr:hypothetical protein Ahy_A04g021551 [Arachis hypogaea]
MEMCYAAQTNKGVVHVYYEHGVSEPVFDEKTGLASSKGKELIVLPDPIPHTYPSINVTANTISTTSPPIPTSEPMNTTIPTPTTIPPTMPTGKGISGPKHKSHTTATSVSYSKSPPKEMAAPTAAASSVKPTPPPKTMAKATVATTSKPNPRPKRMGQSTAAPTTKPNPPPKAVDEESAAVAAAAAAANSDANGGEVNNSAPTAAVNGGDAPVVSQDQVEIQLDLSQPIMSETDDSQQVQQPPVRPSKLPPKRKLSTPSATTQPSSTPSASTTSLPSASTPSATTPSASTLPTSSQPASTETATNLPAMRFVPNPGFKPPRTKN